MKKILIMAAIAFSAISLNAATYSWHIFTETGVGLSTYDASSNGSSTTKLFSGSVTLWAYAYGGSLDEKINIGSLTAVDGVISKTTLSTYGTIAEGSPVTAEGKYNFFLTYIDADTGMEFTSAELMRKQTNQLNGTNISFTANSIANGTWTGENIPEPTSGLLLLCGLAGLALHRKRA